MNINKTIRSVRPEKELLKRTLDKINLNPVTNTEVIRNTDYVGRIINNMNNYIKILSGGAIVSALIIAVVLINKPEPVVTTGTEVRIGGEVLEVDSLLAELDNIDLADEEPVFDDSDLITGLINTNDYEIQ